MQNILKKIIPYILIFSFFFVILFSVHLSKEGFWSTDDPYYHAKHSQLMAETGDLTLVKAWMPFHFLGYAPTDPWWGFHVLSAGFIKMFGVFIGMKVYITILASLIFTLYFFILKDFKISKPFIWTLLFFSSSAFFQYRILLERPLLLALSTLPLAAWLIYRQKYFWLFFLSLVFALLYNLAPLVVFTAGVFFLVEAYLEKVYNLKPLITTSAGVLAGIILHPYSSNYFYVMFIHFWQVLYLRFTGTNLNIGGEVQLKNFFNIISENAIALLFFLISLAIFFAFAKIRKDKLTFFLFLQSGFWFLVSLLVPRAVDFWLPFAWLFIAVILPAFTRLPEYQLFSGFIKSKINLSVLKFLAIPVFLIIVFYNFFQIFDYVYKGNHGKDRDIYYQEASEWLRQHTAPEEIIFYNDWGLWPRMFFFNDHNRYITGMDPTFLYEYDQKLFWLWKNISYDGIFCDQADGCPLSSPRMRLSGIKSVIREKFNANYILLEKNRGIKFKAVLENRVQDFDKVFENETLVIYRVK
ncbi:MAG: hypothetical protein UT64_C0001G0015 [Candidatus Falkowbacteria bacterium GW2011_GWF2_39_8]|uniref:Glycosyltransferase RgtA/B/C/D-like domain-containing protein n=1 Tax=Candidatus Falkowbacteria bacterium GW2011_GWF2_39_8 TaxID=1618642 RepID=A0A0G0Q9D1_9BACT|nr:MAG: hypothetical protein UT64_C0001G0015 [Candidatus Falkowbacteria bacterium GW2011_GWF2_39_8]